MSSLHRQKNRPHWFCAFTGADGKRKFKSTGTSNKEAACVICNSWAKAALLGRKATLTPDRARQIIEGAVGEIVEATGQTLPNSSARDFLTGWVEEKKTSGAIATYARYRGVIGAFLEFLGRRADTGISGISASDIRAFKDSVAKRASPATVNTFLKVLKVAFKRAVAQELLEKSPAALVDNMRREQTNRRAFTLPELRKLLDVASNDWRTMILTALYSGLRLADCANLCWNHIDLLKAEMTVPVRKKNTSINLPIAKPLLRHFESLPTGDNPKAPLCPTLYGKGSAWLSGQFYEIMETAGLVAARDAKKQSSGMGRHARRQLNDISFHSLRHTATSLLKNAGVSDAVAMDIIGHESEAVSRNYTHIEMGTKRAAVDKMPDVTKGCV